MEKEREQVPISFNMNDPIEREMFQWLQDKKGQSNKKGNISAILKKILYSHIDREKELRLWELKTGGVIQSTPPQNDIPEPNIEDDDTDVDTDSLPF